MIVPCLPTYVVQVQHSSQDVPHCEYTTEHYYLVISADLQTAQSPASQDNTDLGGQR